MTVTYLSEENQTNFLANYNQSTTKTSEKIPLVPRNKNTGWPLLQVSLFTPVEGEENAYSPMLGGGVCHGFDHEAFNLATLLTQIPGKIVIRGNNNSIRDKKFLNANFVMEFISHFSFEHANIGLIISSKNSSGYGKKLHVQTPFTEEQSAKLSEALHYGLWVAQNSKEDIEYHKKEQGLFMASHFHNIAPLKNSGRYDEEKNYTEAYIQQNINHQIATFQNGQVFIDLGYFIETIVEDKELTTYFERMFKVKEFVATMSTYEDDSQAAASSSSSSSSNTPKEADTQAQRALISGGFSIFPNPNDMPTTPSCNNCQLF